MKKIVIAIFLENIEFNIVGTKFLLLNANKNLAVRFTLINVTYNS